MAELLFFNFIVALISNTVSSHSQGRVMGIVNGMYGLAAGVFSLFIGVLLELGLAFPIIGSLLFMIASFILLIIYLKINKNIAVEIWYKKK